MKKYLINCFLLLIPIFLWNLILAPYLPKGYSPEVFDSNIPFWIVYPENILRMILFIYPLTMVLSIKTTSQKLGLCLYIFGIVLYFLSWVWVIAYPESDWSTSLGGFTAPAYTPILWLTGIGLIGKESFFRTKFNTVVYVLLAVVFVLVHTKHAMLVYASF